MRLIDYRSTYNVGVFLQLLLGVYTVFAVWSLIAALPYLRALEDLRDSGGVPDVDRFLDIESWYGLAAGFEGFAYLLTGVVWIVWFYRSYKNLEPLGRRREHAAWWAIFGWVIPIVSFYRPRQIAADLWAGSRPPDPAAEPGRWSPTPEVPWYLNAWWGLFLAANIPVVAVRLGANDDSAASFATMVRWEMAGFAILVLCAPFALPVVRSINNRQAILARSLDATAERDL